MIFENYIIQNTLVPASVAGYNPGKDLLLETFTMTNPTSIARALEMWGYGFLGLGTWLCAPFFKNNGIEQVAKILFIMNGVVSIIGAIWTAMGPEWALATGGINSFVARNILFLSMAILAILVFGQRKRSVYFCLGVK